MDYKINIIRLCTLITGILCLSAPVLGRDLVDKICARVNGTNILLSDLASRQISKNGGYYTLDEMIEEELWFQRARDKKVLPSDLDIDKNIVAYKREQNLIGKSDAACDLFLEEEIGINFATYRKQLIRYYGMQNYKGMELAQRAAVSSDEVEAHWKAHPETEEASYWIKMASVDPQQVSFLGNLKQEADQLSWDDLGWMKESKISTNLRSVTRLEKGELSSPIKDGSSYFVLKLVDKKQARLRTLSERYISIETDLHKKKRESFAQEMQKELYSQAVIIRL